MYRFPMPPCIFKLNFSAGNLRTKKNGLFGIRDNSNSSIPVPTELYAILFGPDRDTSADMKIAGKQ
jgi:hypothetical protein